MLPLPWPDDAQRAHIRQLLDAPQGQRIGVLGLGVVGRAMAKLLLARGAQVVAVDGNVSFQHDVLTAIRNGGGEVHLGPPAENVFEGVAALAISPGVSPQNPEVRYLRDKGIPIVGELELVGPLPTRVLAITGTNGKSTTTALVGHLLQALGHRTFVGGNLGDSVADWAASKWVCSDGSEHKADYAVLELSSFQLESSYSFRADAVSFLNLSMDHRDRYDDLESYGQTKANIFRALGDKGIAVVNGDDASVMRLAGASGVFLYAFSLASTKEPERPATIKRWLSGQGERIVGSEYFDGFELAHPKLFGRHNIANTLAAFLCLDALGLLPQDIQQLKDAYISFQGLPHRLQWVGEYAGVRYINDSKATNDEAAAVAVRAVEGPLRLLVGGRDKEAGYDFLLGACDPRVQEVIAFGEAADNVVAAFAGKFPVTKMATLNDAFALAKENAQVGETVLLAPACSSFDAYRNYAERGEAFAAMVRSLSEKGANG